MPMPKEINISKVRTSLVKTRDWVGTSTRIVSPSDAANVFDRGLTGNTQESVYVANLDSDCNVINIKLVRYGGFIGGISESAILTMLSSAYFSEAAQVVLVGDCISGESRYCLRNAGFAFLNTLRRIGGIIGVTVKWFVILIPEGIDIMGNETQHVCVEPASGENNNRILISTFETKPPLSESTHGTHFPAVEGRRTKTGQFPEGFVFYDGQEFTFEQSPGDPHVKTDINNVLRSILGKAIEDYQGTLLVDFYDDGSGKYILQGVHSLDLGSGSSETLARKIVEHLIQDLAQAYMFVTNLPLAETHREQEKLVRTLEGIKFLGAANFG